MFVFVGLGFGQTYVGSATCSGCHGIADLSGTGYDIHGEFIKSGHPYKLNATTDQAPVYPANTSPGVVLPTGHAWSDFDFVIGGYGWKARFVDTTGHIFTGDELSIDSVAQYNLADGSWAQYHVGETKEYNYGCFVCHTTGPSPEGTYNEATPGLGTFAEAGIGCEGCHGPGSAHVASGDGSVALPVQGDSLVVERCGDCHQRDSRTNAIPASKKYIRHHEQFNEMKASRHGDGAGDDLTCADCHNTHIALRYPEAAGMGLSGIKNDCESCHPGKEVTLNGVTKANVDCEDCHMSMASKSALGTTLGNGFRGDVSTHIFQINTDAVPRDSMFTADGGLVKLDEEGLAAVTLDFACLPCHQEKTVEWASGHAKGIHDNGLTTDDETYVGSSICANCHDNVNTTLGYNIWEEYSKSGHPYKLNPVNGGPPTYPANTSNSPSTIPPPPAATDWNNYSFVIGGYGWKARFVKTDGRIFTSDTLAQYNLATQGWVDYHHGEDKKYDYGCFKCHVTGGTADGSWNGVAADSLGTFSEPGIRCEGCHGPAGAHVADPMGVTPPITADSLKYEHCGECHQRDSKTNSIPASKKYIRHHEQFNEMQASKHGQSGFMTCASCHDAHIALHWPDAAGDGLSGITTTCETCHPNKEVTLDGVPKANIDCEDCHMSYATKSAVGTTLGNGFQGDVATHIFKINASAEPRDSMFTADGGHVKLDENDLAAVTLDFACLPCHQSQSLEWAASYADSIHQKGLVSSIENVTSLPAEFGLEQNYPNPFNPRTTIKYALPKASHVRLVIYDIVGKEVAVLIDSDVKAGNHRVVFTARTIASGLYLYRLETDGFVTTKKMLVMK
jgi:hypothetical protein